MLQMLKASAATLCGILTIAGLSDAALATDYQCHLPLETTSTLKGGVPNTETSRDDTISFTINVSRNGDFALIDGFKFLLLKGPGYVAFYGVVNAAANGLDIITIYNAEVGGGLYAVESRQVTILGQPMASQMVGVCMPS